jgi:hypothetical protein
MILIILCFLNLKKLSKNYKIKIIKKMKKLIIIGILIFFIIWYIVAIWVYSEEDDPFLF